MPNHVSNRLTMDGPYGPLRNIRDNCFTLDPELHTTPQFDFNKIIPTPAYINQDNLQWGSEHQKSGRNWYNWNIEHWHTKWNAYDTFITQDLPPTPIDDNPTNPHQLITEFDTAWSPPTPVVATLAQDFPEVAIQHDYIDECWNFFGTDTYQNGEITTSVNIGDPGNDPTLIALRNKLAMELQGYTEESIDEIEQTITGQDPLSEN